jgi:predicted PurR-regulated permease PerM
MNPGKVLSLSPRLIVSLLYYILPLGIVVLSLYFIPALYHLVLMFVFAYLVSHLFIPPVDILERHDFSRNNATLIVFITLIVLIIAFLWAYSPVIWNQALELQQQLAGGDLIVLSRDYARQVEESIPFLAEGSVSERVRGIYAWLLGQLSGILVNIYMAIQYLVIIPFIAFFLVRDRHLIRRHLIKGVPNAFFEMVFNIYFKIDSQVGDYIRGLIIEAAIVAVFCIIGLISLGVPYAIIIGLFAGFANVVPYFGPIAGAVPAILIKFLESGDLSSTLLVALIFVAVQIIDNIWLKPFVFSRGMEMHPLIVFLVVVAGGQLAGVPGMILGIPISASLKVIIGEFFWGVRNYKFEEYSKKQGQY